MPTGASAPSKPGAAGKAGFQKKNPSDKKFDDPNGNLPAVSLLHKRLFQDFISIEDDYSNHALSLGEQLLNGAHQMSQ